MAASLYLAHREVIERVIARVCSLYRLRQPALQDFAQDVRLLLIRDDERVLRMFRSESTFETYLWRVIKRECARWRRGEARRIRYMVRGLSVETADTVLAGALGRERSRAELPSGNDRPDSSHATKLDRAVQALAPGTRQLFVLRFVCRCRAKTIAAEFHTTPKAIYRRLDRLVEELRRAVDGRTPSESIFGSATRRTAGSRRCSTSSRSSARTSTRATPTATRRCTTRRHAATTS